MTRSISVVAVLGATLVATPVLAADAQKQNAAPAAKNAGGTQNAPAAGATPRGEDNIGQGEDFKKDVARRITVEDLQKRLAGTTPVVFLDTRGAPAGPVPKGAMHVTSDQVESWAKNRDKRTLIIAYCT
jgi:hypothetical protein